MPKYTFECEGCSLRFDRVLKIAGNTATHSCPSCKDDVPRIFDGAEFGVSFAPGKGAVANSGVHKDDYPTADRVVGKSAEARWEFIGEREKVKKAAREKGQTHALIRKDGAGFIDYEPMADRGLEGRKKLTKAAIEAARSRRT